MAARLTTRDKRAELARRALAYGRGMRNHDSQGGYTLENAWLAGYRAALRDARRNSAKNRAAVAKRTRS